MVEDHLICHGFVHGYTKWVFHGEGFSLRNTPHPIDEEETSRNIVDDQRDDQRDEGVREGPHEYAKRFFKLVEEGKEELYPGCKNFSKLSFTIRLYLFKCIHKLNDVAFSNLLDLIREAFPFAQIPDSFYKAKKVIKDLGLHYEKIHACTNDCILFWNDNAMFDNFSVCGASRWKNVRNDLNNKVTKIPVKVLRYFPLKPRLQRIFMCSETSVAMRWHDTERLKDGNLRHPADGEAWKDFDSLHPNFANDARNVRLGLSSDGFNPFRTMSISHSTWPVMLMNYNLSPWTCMKSENIMLSVIIPGPSSLGNDIDVYLQPLIAELKELWDVGVETYDAVTNQTFLMHAALLWTISDFPALGMLSGWSTKGRWACPTCAQILEELREINNVFGKNKKKRKRKNDGPWKKKSIFFELPYWATNKLRHNLDVMHIEKNICDSVLGTLLDILGKSKDHISSRYDLYEMGICKELQPLKDCDTGNIHLAKACFSMTPDEKKLF
nr:uncharacterized protein LOC112941461 [Solanum lycopersicum]